MADDIQIQKMDGKSLDVTDVNKEKLKTVYSQKLLKETGQFI